MTNNQKEYILIGGYPAKGINQHPGGQVTATRLLVEYAKANNIKLNIIDTSQNSFPIPSIISRLKQAKKRIIKLNKLLKEKNIDGVIIFSSTGFSFYEKIFMSLITKKYNVQSFLFIRSGHFIDLNMSNKVMKIINKFLLKIPTFIGAQGNKWVDFYQNMNVNLSKVKLIYNWIKIKKENTYQTSDDQVVFLYAGWMVQKKGVVDLFDVIQKNNDLKSYTFRFAGEGTLFESLKERKEKYNLDNIELLGWVDEKNMLDEYKKADIFILPSHAEGFPNAVLEALNCRLPIISTNVGGIPDSIIDGYNGYIFEPNDQKVMYEKIKKLGESSEKRIEFSQNCNAILMKHHDFNKNCQHVFDSFKNKQGNNK